MSRHAHLYGRAWRKRRARQLALHPICVICFKLRALIVTATVADHVIPHRGDVHMFRHGELQSLCQSCHSSFKQQLEVRGFIAGCDLTGMPLDPEHPWNREPER